MTRPPVPWIDDAERPVAVAAPNEGRARPRPPASRRLAALPALAVAIALLALAAPRAIGSLISGASEPVIRKAQDQQPVSVEEAETLIAAETRGHWVSGDPAMLAEVGRGELLLVEKLSLADPRSREHLDAAIAELEDSLAAAPAHPLPWTLLSYARFLRDGAWSEGSVEALRLSIETSPFDPELIWSRLRLALFAWDLLGPEERELTAQQVQHAWRLNADALVALAIDLQKKDIVHKALSVWPEDAQQFDALTQRGPR